MRSNSGDTCRIAALGGAGIVSQPDFLVGEDIARGTLVELMPDWRAARYGVHAVYPSRRHVPPKVRRMIDWLADTLAPRTAARDGAGSDPQRVLQDSGAVRSQ